MSQVAFTSPVEDSVTKINQEIAVGEDLAFQRTWWRFENAVWTVFSVLLVLALAGAFGRGPLSHDQIRTPEMHLRYERIARTGTPSLMRITFAPSAIHNGKIRLFVSETVVDELGNQRVIPAPEATTIGDHGLIYTFPATTSPAAVAFALQPAGPGIFHFDLVPEGGQRVHARVIVMP